MTFLLNSFKLFVAFFFISSINIYEKLFRSIPMNDDRIFSSYIRLYSLILLELSTILTLLKHVLTEKG